MKKFPILYHKTATGKINTWEVWAKGNKVYTRWGQQDGKMQESCKEVTQKNIGKSNETSLRKQAILEAESMWNHKKERKYSEKLKETAKTIYLPMLAKDFKKRRKFVTPERFPANCQPKLDGVRCLASWHGKDKIKLTSRGGKEYILPHITEELEKCNLPRGDVLDGELYVHGVEIQNINKLVRRTKNMNSESIKVEYHIYDYCNPEKKTLPWQKRKKLLDNFFKGQKFSKIKKVKTTKVNSVEDILDFEKECISEGYEGAIVRFHDGLYKFGYRSSDLLKVKSFEDNEFEIIGFNNGKGKFKDCIIYECLTKEGKSFTVVPKGTFEERAKWLKEGKKHIGQMLKVKHFGWTNENKPFHPVGLCIRLEEDM